MDHVDFIVLSPTVRLPDLCLLISKAMGVYFKASDESLLEDDLAKRSDLFWLYISMAASVVTLLAWKMLLIRAPSAAWSTEVVKGAAGRRASAATKWDMVKCRTGNRRVRSEERMRCWSGLPRYTSSARVTKSGPVPGAGTAEGEKPRLYSYIEESIIVIACV